MCFHGYALAAHSVRNGLAVMFVSSYVLFLLDLRRQIYMCRWTSCM